MYNLPEPGTIFPIIYRREVILPTCVYTLHAGRSHVIEELREAADDEKFILCVYQPSNEEDAVRAGKITVGTLCKVLFTMTRPEGTLKCIIQGDHRVIIDEVLQRADDQDYATILPFTSKGMKETIGLTLEYKMFREYLDRYLNRDPVAAPKIKDVLQTFEIEEQIDALAQFFTQEQPVLYCILKEDVLVDRIRFLAHYVAMKSDLIDGKHGALRERYCEEKSKQEDEIHEESILTRFFSPERDLPANALVQRIQEGKHLPPRIVKMLKLEVDKMLRSPVMSGEAAVSHNLIDTVLNLPWNTYTPEVRNINFAREVLDHDHYGLEKPKERILEMLAVFALSKEPNSTILCFVGPPGVGKTSLGRSIAIATNRNFVRISLGGVGDHAEIRGHRRTYLGSMPGKLIMALSEAKSSNPVILLDEIDKLGRDMRGDPASALLEVLDPNQNSSFRDHFIDTEYDLSKVMFICTANDRSTIPPALIDRMEVIELVGYTYDEKAHIARRHLIPKQKKLNGVEPLNLTFSDEALQLLANNYTREAGVRNLEREIGAICRKIAFKYVEKAMLDDPKRFPKPDSKLKSYIVYEDPDDPEASESKPEVSEGEKEQGHVGEKPANIFTTDGKPIESPLPENGVVEVDWPEEEIIVTPELLEEYLGHPKFFESERDAFDQVGVTTGLAWTAAGGVPLIAEVLILPGTGKLVITGKLGEVMKESASAALSYVRSRTKRFGLPDDFHTTSDIHIHFPKGATPKDGPSAGVTMTVSLVSALTKIPVRHDVAMTGEVTLRGRILPIGGVKEKVMAAHRVGVRKVLIPEENVVDLDEVPENVVKEIEIIPVKHVDDVLKHALVEMPPLQSPLTCKVDS